MPSRQLPGLGLTAYWDVGASGWDAEHDPDTRALSVLCQCRVISAVTELPATPDDGEVYIAPPDDPEVPLGIVARDNGDWVYFTPQPGFVAYVADVGEFVAWDDYDAAWRPVNSAKISTYSDAVSLEPGMRCGTRLRLEDVSITITDESVAPYPIGFWFEVEQAGSTSSTIIASSVTLNTAKTLTLLGRYAVAKVMKVGYDEWTVSGDLENP